MAKIEAVDVAVYKVPTATPESDGTFAWDQTTLVAVELRCEDRRGFGYTYADTATARLIADVLQPVIIDRDPYSIQGAYDAMVQSIRNLGRAGIASMAISAVDIALWDLKAKILDLPLAQLLGQVRDRVPIYGSGGFTSYTISQLREQLSGWVMEGIRRVKMKIGRHPEWDLERVQQARLAIGDDAELFVDANGAYNVKQALQLAQRFAEQGVAWFEEPVSSDDLAGLHLVRQRAPAEMQIAAGEYGYQPLYFRRMLEAGAVDCLQADVTRCEGITGFLRAAALADAWHIPLSGHCAPSLHVALGCALANVRHLEYFFDHARIEQMFFDGAPLPKNGDLAPDLSRPGLGLELRRADAESFLVSDW
jgi:L-alanine-DL-glutamate epimerase-like enolase superfamily enzyme